MSLSPQDIQNREFREAFRGYNEDDVDTFLDQVAEEFGRLFAENQRIRIQIASAQQELARLGDRGYTAPAPVMPAPVPVTQPRPGEPVAGRTEAREEMKRALVATQRAAEAALEEAKRRGAEIVSRAEQRAREIDELTARRAKDIDSDASTVLTMAQQRVEELKHQESEIRLRLRRMLAEHVRVLQQLEGAEPGARPRRPEKPATGGNQPITIPEAAPPGGSGQPLESAGAPTEVIGGVPRSATVERMQQELGEQAEAPGRRAGRQRLSR